MGYVIELSSDNACNSRYFDYCNRSYGLKGFLLVAVLHKKYVAVRYWYVLNEKCDAYFFNTKKKIFKLYDTMAIISPQKKNNDGTSSVADLFPSPAEWNAQRKKEGEQGA